MFDLFKFIPAMIKVELVLVKYILNSDKTFIFDIYVSLPVNNKPFSSILFTSVFSDI